LRKPRGPGILLEAWTAGEGILGGQAHGRQNATVNLDGEPRAGRRPLRGRPATTVKERVDPQRAP